MHPCAVRLALGYAYRSAPGVEEQEGLRAEHLRLGGVQYCIDALACYKSVLPDVKKRADVTVDGVEPFCWANDFIVPIFVPGRTYEHAALPDCEDTAVVIFAFALALIKEYGAALDEYEFFPESD